MVLFVFKNPDSTVQIREAEGEKLLVHPISSFSQYVFNTLMFTGPLTPAHDGEAGIQSRAHGLGCMSHYSV